MVVCRKESRWYYNHLPDYVFIYQFLNKREVLSSIFSQNRVGAILVVYLSHHLVHAKCQTVFYYNNRYHFSMEIIFLPDIKKKTVLYLSLHSQFVYIVFVTQCKYTMNIFYGKRPVLIFPEESLRYDVLILFRWNHKHQKFGRGPIIFTVHKV